MRLSICVGLLIVFEIVLANNVKDLAQPDSLLHNTSHDIHASRTGRFGFHGLEIIRKNFCRSFCTSADTMAYLANLMCAIKCPELYLPHNMTTTSTTMNVETTSGTTISPAGPANPSNPSSSANPPSTSGPASPSPSTSGPASTSLTTTSQATTSPTTTSQATTSPITSPATTSPTTSPATTSPTTITNQS
nr:PREDICTED: salivary glue protein Sgs-3-like [Linepithema humile]